MRRFMSTRWSNILDVLLMSVAVVSLFLDSTWTILLIVGGAYLLWCIIPVAVRVRSGRADGGDDDD